MQFSEPVRIPVKLIVKFLALYIDAAPQVRQHYSNLCGESTALSPLPLIFSYKSEQSLCGAAAASTARDGSAFPSHMLGTFEAILSRLSWRLAATLQPLLFSVAPETAASKSASLDTSAAVTPAPAEQLGSFFDLSLLCHHIILGGEDLYSQALETPEQTLRAVMPLVATSSDAWCACTPPVAAENPKEQPAEIPRRLCAASGCALWAVLRYEVLCLHATKFRLNKKTCAPNNISSSVENAGFFELFDYIAEAVPLPSTPSEKQTLGDWGAQEMCVLRAKLTIIDQSYHILLFSESVGVPVGLILQIMAEQLPENCAAEQVSDLPPRCAAVLGRGVWPGRGTAVAKKASMIDRRRTLHRTQKRGLFHHRTSEPRLHSSFTRLRSRILHCSCICPMVLD